MYVCMPFQVTLNLKTGYYIFSFIFINYIKKITIRVCFLQFLLRNGCYMLITRHAILIGCFNDNVVI